MVKRSYTKRSKETRVPRKRFQTIDSGVRHGKWTPEEEEYADFIVKEFLKGSLPDCEEGCTLRCYLSEKLNCQKMRISKKFAGRCIGKVF